MSEGHRWDDLRKAAKQPDIGHRIDDAIRNDDSSVIELGDDTLKAIAHELVELVGCDAKTDWAVKEQVRAKLRATIKRMLRKYGYPPNQAKGATKLVLTQTEVIAVS